MAGPLVEGVTEIVFSSPADWRAVHVLFAVAVQKSISSRPRGTPRSSAHACEGTGSVGVPP